MTGKSILLAAALCGIVLTATLPAAHAQSAPARVATRDELRECLASGDSLRARQQELAQRDKRAAESSAALRAEAAQLAEDKKGIEDRPEATRTSFERRLRAYNAKLPAEKSNAEALKADLDAFNAAVAAHNTQCAHMTVRPEDREAVEKEREAKAK